MPQKMFELPSTKVKDVTLSLKSSSRDCHSDVFALIASVFCPMGQGEKPSLSGYKFYFHLLGSTGSQLDVAQPRALTLSLEEYTTINYSHFCPSVRVVMSSISLLHVPSFLSHFLAICVSSWDLDFSPSFSILSPS